MIISGAVIPNNLQVFVARETFNEDYRMRGCQRVNIYDIFVVKTTSSDNESKGSYGILP